MINNIIIRNISERDYPTVKSIFEEGIATGNATFEKTAPDWEHWNSAKLPFCRLAAVLNNEMIGWAALSPTSARDVYKGICEESIYLRSQHSGKGAGKILMNALIEESEKNGVWTLYASIFPENTASIKLHLSCGFREIGFMEKAGCMNGTWRDTVLFERRSKVTGI